MGFHDLYRIMKSRLQWTGHEVRMRATSNAYRVSVGKTLYKNCHSEDQEGDKRIRIRIRIRRISWKQVVRM
jgi:hypothetical protein